MTSRRRVTVGIYDAECDLVRPGSMSMVRAKVDVMFSSFDDAEAFWESLMRIQRRGEECTLEYEHLLAEEAEAVTA